MISSFGVQPRGVAALPTATLATVTTLMLLLIVATTNTDSETTGSTHLRRRLQDDGPTSGSFILEAFDWCTEQGPLCAVPVFVVIMLFYPAFWILFGYLGILPFQG